MDKFRGARRDQWDKLAVQLWSRNRETNLPWMLSDAQYEQVSPKSHKCFGIIVHSGRSAEKQKLFFRYLHAESKKPCNGGFLSADPTSASLDISKFRSFSFFVFRVQG